MVFLRRFRFLLPIRHQVEVTTVNPCVIRQVYNDRAIAEKGDSVLHIRKEEVPIQDFEVAIGSPDRAMFSAHVADLACLRYGGIARRLVTAHVRV